MKAAILNESSKSLIIDDIDFEATNNGVWCFNLSDVCTDDNKTTWDKYKSDKIL